MARAAVFVAVTVAVFLALSYLVNGLLGVLFAVVALAYGLNRLLKRAQGVRNEELPGSSRWWVPW